MLFSLLRRLYTFSKWRAYDLYFRVFPYTVLCNLCGHRDWAFRDDDWHPQAICPRCSSSLRQRLFWGLVEKHPFFKAGTRFREKKILHFAPDRLISEKLQKLSAHYQSADALEEGYQYLGLDLVLDMADMGILPDSSYDFLLAFDVLEHIVPHMEALKESYRILKPGAYAIFTVPQQDHLAQTFENPQIDSPEEREKYYGQWDHQRMYGLDFGDFLAEAGFEFQVLDHQSLDEKYVRTRVLFPPKLSSRPLATNFRKFYLAKKV